jgi:hypothetical protein
VLAQFATFMPPNAIPAPTDPPPPESRLTVINAPPITQFIPLYSSVQPKADPNDLALTNPPS